MITFTERRQVSDEIFDNIKDCSDKFTITHDRFVDLFDVYAENFNFYIPPPDNAGHVADIVNDFLAKRTYKRNGFLFTISLFKDKDDPNIISVNIPVIGHDSWGSEDWIMLRGIMFNYEYAKDILPAIYTYLTENLIVYCLNTIKDDSEEIYESDYVKALIVKAKRDYAELKLIIQASSI